MGQPWANKATNVSAFARLPQCPDHVRQNENEGPKKLFPLFVVSLSAASERPREPDRRDSVEHKVVVTCFGPASARSIPAPRSYLPQSHLTLHATRPRACSAAPRCPWKTGPIHQIQEFAPLGQARAFHTKTIHHNLASDRLLFSITAFMHKI